MSNWKKATKSIVVVLVLGALIIIGVRIVKMRKAAIENASPPRSIPPLVQTVMPEEGRFPVTSRFLGTIRAKVAANISPRVQEHILSLEFREGDRVKKGEVICRLDHRVEKARVLEISSRLSAARTELATQEAIYKRDMILFQNKALSREELELSKARRDAARGEVEALEAELKAARADLSYTVIRAPFTGVVTKRILDPGDLAVPGQPIISMESMEDGYYVEIKVPQDEFSQFKKGQTVLILQDNPKNSKNSHDPKDIIKTHISRLHPQITSGTMAVLEADLDERPFQLPTGSTVVTTVIKGQVQGIKVPARAILENVGKTFCFFVDEADRVRIEEVNVLFMGEKFGVLEKKQGTPLLPVIVAQESALLRLHNGDRVRRGEGPRP